MVHVLFRFTFAAQVSFLLYQALDALAFCHAQRIAHCDLKPSNIYVNRDCRLKLGDFGLSRFMTVKKTTQSHQPEQQGPHLKPLGHSESHVSVFGNSDLSTEVPGIEVQVVGAGAEAEAAAQRSQTRMRSKSGGAGGPGPAAAPDAGGGGGGALSPYYTPLPADGTSTVVASSASSLSSYLAPAAPDGLARKWPRYEEADDTAGGGALASGGGGVAAAAPAIAIPDTLGVAAPPIDHMPTAAFLPPPPHATSLSGVYSTVPEVSSLVLPKVADGRASTQPATAAPTAPHPTAHVLMAECAYRAPEVLWPAQLEQVSAAQDLWALGCVFWELLNATAKPEKTSSAASINGSSSSSGNSSTSICDGRGGDNSKVEEAPSSSSEELAMPPLPLDDQGRILGGYRALSPLFAPLEEPPAWISSAAAAAVPIIKAATSSASTGVSSAAAPTMVPSRISTVASPLRRRSAQPQPQKPVMIPRPGNRFSGASTPGTVSSGGKGTSSSSSSSTFDNGSRIEAFLSRSVEPPRGSVCYSPGIPRRTSASNLQSGSPQLHYSGKGGRGNLTLASSNVNRPLSKDSQFALATFLTVLGPAAAAFADETSDELCLSAAAKSFVVASAKYLGDAKPLFPGDAIQSSFKIEAEEVLRSLLSFTPTRRPSAFGALKHRFFRNCASFDQSVDECDSGGNGNGTHQNSTNSEQTVIHSESTINSATSERNQMHAEGRSSDLTPPSVAISQRSVRRELWAETNGRVGGPPKL